MSARNPDARFPAWEPNVGTVKVEILYHMDYAHEEQARKEGRKWWGLNVDYWKRKYTRQQLLDIHDKYHGRTVKEAEG